MRSMPSRRLPKQPSQKQLDRAFKPYAVEIGTITREWNLLQENLGKIFARILDHPTPSVPMAIWYSTQNDRSQRDMLRAICEATFRINPQKYKHLSDAIKWLLKNANDLADRRNNAIHAPLIMTTSDAFVGVEVMAEYFYGNPRAIKLKDKDILTELKWYRGSAEVLRDYALNLWFSLGHPDRSLPQRPEMPRLEQSPIRRQPRHRDPAK
jgi:hypothetical protein